MKICFWFHRKTNLCHSTMLYYPWVNSIRVDQKSVASCTKDPIAVWKPLLLIFYPLSDLAFNDLMYIMWSIISSINTQIPSFCSLDFTNKQKKKSNLSAFNTFCPINKIFVHCESTYVIMFSFQNHCKTFPMNEFSLVWSLVNQG